MYFNWFLYRLIFLCLRRLVWTPTPQRFSYRIDYNTIYIIGVGFSGAVLAYSSRLAVAILLSLPFFLWARDCGDDDAFRSSNELLVSRLQVQNRTGLAISGAWRGLASHRAANSV